NSCYMRKLYLMPPLKIEVIKKYGRWNYHPVVISCTQEKKTISNEIAFFFLLIFLQKDSQ
ncbi:MAG: hypothetical protein ACI8RP_000888, partial [Urechidicola sp.]